MNYLRFKRRRKFIKNGFYAEELEDERKIEGLFVDQLILINDVTNEIKNYMNSGKTDEEKLNCVKK